MPGPGGAPGMGGMSPPGGEISEDLAKMMGGGTQKSSSGGVGAQAGGAGASSSPAPQAQAPQPSAPPPREVVSIQEEVNRGVNDIFQGLKNFFKLNTWLGIDPEKLDPQQEAHAKQLHSRYQQLDEEQKAVAKQMYETEMQKKKLLHEEEERKKQLQAEQQAQAVVMPSGPQKGPVGPGGGKSKKQNAMQKLQQSRTSLGNLQGE